MVQPIRLWFLRKSYKVNDLLPSHNKANDDFQDGSPREIICKSFQRMEDRLIIQNNHERNGFVKGLQAMRTKCGPNICCN